MNTLPPIEPQPSSPFLTIWTKPRETIRSLVDQDPTRHVILLAALAGLFSSLGSAISYGIQGLFLPFALMVALAVIIGPLFGIAGLYISAWVYRWTGSWMGGTASIEQVRTAVAWSFLPNLLGTLVAGIPMMLFTWYEVNNNIPNLEPILNLAVIGFGLFSAVFSIWSLVILCQGLGEVHHFSGWTGFAAVFVGNLIVGVPFVCLVSIITTAFIGL